jgi:hypothetical protein
VDLVERQRGRQRAGDGVGQLLRRTGGRRGAGDAMQRLGRGLSALT